MNIGFIGFGSMGKPMAYNLAAAGDLVLAYDVDATKLNNVDSTKIIPSSSPAALARECQLIVTMVWNDDALQNIVYGADGILTEQSFKGCLVDLSTTSVKLARDIGDSMERSGASFLDGAVIGGGVPSAIAGQSPIVLAGDQDAFLAALPRLSRLGTCDYVGKQGAAKTVKIINNLLVGVVTASNAEALSLGVSAGLQLSGMVELLADGTANSTVLRSYMGSYVREGIYGQGLIGHSLMAKDLALACELAEETGVMGVSSELARQLYLHFARINGGDKPFPSSYDYFRGLHNSRRGRN